MNCKMRLKTLFAILSVCTLTFAQSETATMHLTLDKALEIALSDNPTMKVAEKEIKLKEVSETIYHCSNSAYTVIRLPKNIVENNFTRGSSL